MSTSRAVVWSARAVQEAIGQAGRTRRSISEETGIPYASLNRKLAGKTGFTFSELFLIAEATGVRPSRFAPPRLGSRP